MICRIVAAQLAHKISETPSYGEFASPPGPGERG
jgi:hypothetical protein